MRDVVLEETFYHDFTTRAFATGIPTVLSGTPALSVLEENNATPITAGVSVSVDRASVVGLNMATVVATAANGYENGKGYSIYISTGTVGGVSVVGEVVGQFTIGASAAAQDLANGTDGLGAIKAETALIVADTNELQTDDVPGLIAALNDPTVAAIADGVWDEVLTGATHNVANSGARRLRSLQEAGAYSGGAIYIDTVNGAAGTTDFENGTDTNPVSTIADANTLAASLGISKFVVLPGSTITFAATQTNQTFEGENWTLALGGQSIVGSTIKGATVSGVASGTGATQRFEHCIMNACSHIKGTHILTSSIAGTQTVAEAGDFFLDRCHSGIAGTATWIWEFGDAIGNTNLNVRNYSGGIQLESMGDTGTDTASIEGQGQIVEGTCVGGAVTIRGMFTTSGITNITLTDNARIDTAQINAQADLAITDAGLDHLVSAAVVGADVTDNSIVAQLVSKSATADWDSYVNTTDSLEANIDGQATNAQIADAVWDEAAAGHVAAGSMGEQIGTDIDAILVDTAEIGAAGAGLTAIPGIVSLHSGTADAGAAGTIDLETGVASTTDDLYNGALIALTGGTGAGQSRFISDYNGTTQQASINPDWTTNPDATTTYSIVPDGRKDIVLWGGGIINAASNGRVPANAEEISGDATAADNMELDYDGTGYAKANSTIGTTTTNTDMRGTDSASTHAAATVARLVIPQQNVAFSDITFEMYDSTTHNPASGLTVTGTRSLDGGAYGAVTGTIAEIASGTYQLDASQADMNGAMIVFRFASATADETFVHVKTTP